MIIKSVYRRAADNGWKVGLYLTAISMTSLLSAQYTLLGIFTLTLLIGIPFMTFTLLRKMYVEELGNSRFSALWTYGILLFFFGSLITGIVTYIYLQFINPTYMYDTMMQTLKLLQSNPLPDSKELINLIQNIIDNKLIPSPIQVVMQMIWLTILFGSLLSAILSGIVQLFKIKNANS